MKPTERYSPTLSYLIGILALIIILSLTVIALMPRIRESVEQSNMVPMIREHLEQSSKGEPLYTLYYPLMSNAQDTYRYTRTSVPGGFSESSYHSLLESLFGPVPQGPLLEGAVTFIPAGTRLIGFTVRDSIGYLALSEDFLDETAFESGSYEKRFDQVRKNLTENFSLDEVLFIVGDEIIE